MHRTHDQQESSDHDGHHDVVKHQVVLEIDQTKQLAAWHGLQTIFTAGERGLERHKKQHLRQCERDHGRIDARAPDGEKAHDQPQQSATKRTQQQTDFRRQAPHLDRVAGDIRRTAQKRGVAERQHAGVAEQQVEGGGKQCEAHELHHKHRIGTKKRCQQQADEQQAIAYNSEILEVHVVGPVNFLCRTGRRGESAARSP
ncbi:hypothetical protein D3C71_1536750 [compost metagenome]